MLSIKKEKREVFGYAEINGEKLEIASAIAITKDESTGKVFELMDGRICLQLACSDPESSQGLLVSETEFNLLAMAVAGFSQSRGSDSISASLGENVDIKMTPNLRKKRDAEDKKA